VSAETKTEANDVENAVVKGKISELKQKERKDKEGPCGLPEKCVIL
jgi:hypothetical protein